MSNRLCKYYLWTWRSELYLEQAQRIRSLPFFETTIEKNTKANVFHSLKWYAEHRLEKAHKMQTAVQLYSDSLASRVMGTLRLHANFKIQSRIGIEFMSVQRSKANLTTTFRLLKELTYMKKELRVKGEQIASRTKRRTEQTAFALWKQKIDMAQIMGPS